MAGVVQVWGGGAGRTPQGQVDFRAGRELSVGFHSQLVRLFILFLKRAPSAKT